MILALSQAQQTGDSGGFIALLFFLGFLFLFVIVPLAATWQIFAKAGQPGWAALVPIYNLVVLLQIVRRPIWWLALLLVPFVNFVVSLVLLYDLARVFGKGIGFTVGLILLPPVFLSLLGFSEDLYLGEGGAAMISLGAPLGLAGTDARSSSASRSASVPLSSNEQRQAMNLGSPLEIVGVVLSLLLILIFAGIIGVQLSGRNRQASAPVAQAPAGQAAAPAPIQASLPTGQQTHPATGMEEPVLRGTFVIGEQVTATLDELFVAHDWNFVGVAGQRVTVSCESADGATTDPVVELIGADGRVLGKDDDGGDGQSALLSGITLPSDGTYTVRVTVWSSGGYVLQVQ